jgi:hypothetical protein
LNLVLFGKILTMCCGEGLQLFDPISNAWYDGPMDPTLGLIWAGKPAAD